MALVHEQSHLFVRSFIGKNKRTKMTFHYSNVSKWNIKVTNSIYKLEPQVYPNEMETEFSHVCEIVFCRAVDFGENLIQLPIFQKNVLFKWGENSKDVSCGTCSLVSSRKLVDLYFFTIEVLDLEIGQIFETI